MEQTIIYPCLDLSPISLPGEIWRELPMVKGYKISNFGRIRSKTRAIRKITVLRSYSKKNQDYTLQPLCQIMVDKKYYKIAIRRMVYYCFCKQFDLSDSYLQIIVKNGNGLDVRPENLKLTNIKGKVQRLVKKSRMQNTFDHVDLKEVNKKSIAVTAKSVSQYDNEGRILQTFKSIHQAARSIGISANQISGVCNGRGITAGGYVWKHENSDDPIC